MFNFTGSARRPRNVNLSGRKSTAPPPTLPSSRSKQAPSASLVTAREQRAQRAAEQRRLKAATTIQRTWRGRTVTHWQRQRWAQQWESLLTRIASTSQTQPDAWWGLVRLFVAMAEMGRRLHPGRWNEQERRRIGVVVEIGVREKETLLEARDVYLLRRLATVLVKAIEEGVIERDRLGVAAQMMGLLADRLPRLDEYYGALAKLTLAFPGGQEGEEGSLVNAVVDPLRLSDPLNHAYFGAYYLSTPDLTKHLSPVSLRKIEARLDLQLLYRGFQETGVWAGSSTENKLWVLAHVIYFSYQERLTARSVYVPLLSLLLGPLAAEISQRIDVEDVVMKDDDSDDEGSHRQRMLGRRLPLPQFVRAQVSRLIEQDAISRLIGSMMSKDEEARRSLGLYLLTLLLMFPARKSEIRLWLCLANTADGIPTIRFLFDGVTKHPMWKATRADVEYVVKTLKHPPEGVSPTEADSLEKQWSLVFLFLEIYGFVLSVTDDTEFFAGGSEKGKGRQLPLEHVKELTAFLKNLGFAMYWWGGELMGDDKSNDQSGEVFFKSPEPVLGRPWDVKGFRDVTTNVTRSIYARDSRRRFLPPDHWLMIDRFNMDGFIPVVVQEEETRQRQIEADSDEEQGDEDERDVDPEALAALDNHTRRLLQLQKMQRENRRRQKLNYLASIAPRLEILHHLPFFIPFDTRVEIFREFVNNDQKARRGGSTDPDVWRHTLARNHPGHDQLSRRHATIRRGQEFKDALQAFWTLGNGLKEPIQITFMNKFGNEEAGIDGGGVTKEFLTGVCGEAFAPSADLSDGNDGRHREEDTGHLSSYTRDLFKANNEQLLYPNPTSIEALRFRLSGESPSIVRESVNEILMKYEFAGRILGKCLYEGILIDVAFAPFFLLKWAQPTSVGINDLADLDSEVYRHLMTLKDWEGDVESDFGLDFTVDVPVSPTRKVTKLLKPNGNNIPVTNRNRLEYIHLRSKYHLHLQPLQQTTAFLRGLTTIIKSSWLGMFNQSELQKLVGGDMTARIDVEDLKRNTVYGGVYNENHETIKMFWRAMEEFDDEQRGRVLKFVTSVGKQPLLGFGQLKPKFSIHPGGVGEDQQYLCTASTCVNLLKLPKYKDYNTLREKLLYSANSGAGFDMS